MQTPEQQKWATKLIGFQFEIHYKLGAANKVADALSCSFPPEPQAHELIFNALSTTIPSVLTDLQGYYNSSEGKTEMQNKVLEKEYY